MENYMVSAWKSKQQCREELIRASFLKMGIRCGRFFKLKSCNLNRILPLFESVANKENPGSVLIFPGSVKPLML